MSFSYAYIAATTDLVTLRSAVLEAWTALELAEPAREFRTWDEAYAWAGSRNPHPSGRHPDEVMLLFADHAWSVVADLSMLLGVDDSALSQLSHRVGRVVAATTQGTSGFAQLRVFEAGTLVRELTGQAGKVTVSGAPLPEETGVDLDSFYLNELDAIWCRLGLTSFLRSEPAGPVVAMRVLDRTEYPSESAAAHVAALPPSKVERRPWWKFW